MSNTYPKSIIYFYKTKIKPEKNAFVEDLEDYLVSTVTGTNTGIECQYIKHALNLTLKINAEEGKQISFDSNYCKITNYATALSAEKTIYYFITNMKVFSENTIELTLALDTVNTLGKESDSPANPKNFLSNTQITRQHKDRFIKPTSWNPAVGGVLIRKIDAESEGIVPTKVRKSGTNATNGGDVILKTADDYDWYIIYKSDQTNGVSSELCASAAISVGVQSQGLSKTFTVSDFDSNKYYYFLDVDNAGGTFGGVTVDSDINKCITTATNYGVNVVDSVAARKLTAFVFWNDNGTLKYTCIYDNVFLIWDGTPQQTTDETIWGNSSANTVGSGVTGIGTKWTTISSITCTQGNFFRVSNIDYTATVNSSAGIAALVSQEAGIYVGSQTSQVLNTIDDIDRTNSKIVKIIKYPYCPIPYVKTNNYFDFGNDWEYTNGLMKYNKTGIPSFGQSAIVSFPNLNETRISLASTACSPLHSKILEAESKLYHSDLYTVKLIYDSFAAPINFEQFDFATNSNDTNILIDFKPTSTINSKFAFKIDSSNLGTYNNVTDFEQFLLVTRNNEETILNNEYINYIKNGYNYDKKANALSIEQAQRNAKTNTIGSILSGLGAAASFAAAPFTGGMSVAAGIGLATAAITSTVSAANAWDNVNKTIENQNNTMASKLANLQAQAASTSGTDDVDLMSWYSGNRLHVMRYQPIAQVREALYNAFDLTGYSYHFYAVPSVDTRYWYNFIQCVPSLSVEGVNKIKQEWLEDLKNRYRIGVTVFHHHRITGDSDSWNLDQLYENWENWIVNGIS